MSRRVYCAGTDRPCPAHAWWFYEGTGRPRERCPRCWAEHDRERRRENHRNEAWKQQVLALAAASVSRGEGAR